MSPAPVCVIKKPSECTADEIDRFCKLVDEGGEVVDGLRNRVTSRGVTLAFIRIGDEIAAVGALKRPYESYRQRVAAKSEVGLDVSTYPAELGWIFVAKSHRGKRLSNLVVEKLLADWEMRKIASQSAGGLFATSDVANAVMHKTLKHFSFVEAGKPYSSDKDAGMLRVFVRPAARAHGLPGQARQ